MRAYLVVPSVPSWQQTEVATHSVPCCARPRFGGAFSFPSRSKHPDPRTGGRGPGNCHLRRCALDANDLLTGSVKYEAVVVKLSSGEALRVLHDLQRFNHLMTHRRGNTRTGGRGRPHSETSRDHHSGGSGKQGDLAHLRLSGAISVTVSNLPGPGFGRCDGHHKMVDLEPLRCVAIVPSYGLSGRIHRAVPPN